MNTKRKGLPPIAYIGAALLVFGGGYMGLNAINLGDPSPLNQLAYGNEARQLTVLGDTFSGYSTLRADPFAAKITQADLGIRYQDEFDQAARAKALGQKADIIVTTLDQYLKHQPQGRIVGLIDKTVGADAVVLNTQQYPELKGLNDIAKVHASASAPLKLVYSAGTPSEYLAKLLDLKFEGLSLADFEVVEVEESTQAYELLKSDSRVAIAILWEPFVSKARKEGNTVVLSSSDVPDAIIDVIVASNPLIQNRPEDLSQFLTLYYQHTDQLIRDSGALSQQIGKDGNLSTQDATSVSKGIDFFTALESNQWMNAGTLAQRIEATSAVLSLTGETAGVVQNPRSLYTQDFIAQAVTHSEQLVASIAATDPELAKVLRGQKSSTTKVQVTPQQIQSAPQVGNFKVRGEVKFATGSAVLSGDSQSTLKALAKEINEFNPSTIAVNVVGHTSKTGSAATNQTLSQQRAQVVANFLRSQGVRPNLVAEGKGFSEQLPGVDPASPAQQRTEIQLRRIGG
ncbi:phosphate ABC transporter substrate-binding/OmpA family protein [Acaryochloris sp. CCMEE 5410]|uniref:phosphate ABC transporter substrate-binding/OmpA family protein n=1 Tax=Acaryochloris sp. CCMEE 5410 TaxID=310037 RepID=UPI0002484A73|nr:phosphate ABC transporter substrate-binding/OmpA family protein [Acaryochloris sp. CCMEE 5410]KAI9133191.1 OmpA family protein [Acaryochloris sp. CCMEE 5410]